MRGTEVSAPTETLTDVLLQSRGPAFGQCGLELDSAVDWLCDFRQIT